MELSRKFAVMSYSIKSTESMKFAADHNTQRQIIGNNGENRQVQKPKVRDKRQKLEGSKLPGIGCRQFREAKAKT